MQKIYKGLTLDQIKQGIIFTSTLSVGKTERMEDLTHEVKNTDEDRVKKIERLKDDSFFNNSPYKYNIIRK